MENPVTYTLRTFREEDLGEVMRINQLCLPENYSTYFFLDLSERFSKGFIVAEAEGKIIGYIMCRVEHGASDFKRFSFTKKGHIVSIAVLAEYRRMGIGKALIVEALKNMVDNDAKECFLEVRVSNAPAVSLYKRLGFMEVKRVRGYYYDGEDAYVMSVKLPLET